MVVSESSGDSKHLYPNPSELGQLITCCPYYRTRLAVRIGARAGGPRLSILASLERGDFYRSDVNGVEIPFVHLRDSKDTSEDGGDGQDRIAWVPLRLYREVQRYCDRNNIDEDEQIFDVQGGAIRDNFERAGKKLAERTGDDIWENFRPHDCRRFYASHCYYRLNLPKRLLMQMGGWKTHGGIEPYLRKMQPRQIQDELESRGIPDQTLPDPKFDDSHSLMKATLEFVDLRIHELMKSLHGDGSGDGEFTMSDMTSVEAFLRRSDFDPDHGDHFINCDEAPYKEPEKNYRVRHGGGGKATIDDYSDGRRQNAFIPIVGEIVTASRVTASRFYHEVEELIEPEQYAVPTLKRAIIGIPAMALAMLLCGVAMASNGVHATANGIVVPEGQLVPLVLGSAIAALTMLVADYRERYGTDRWTSGI